MVQYTAASIINSFDFSTVGKESFDCGTLQ